jgi:hypothetical protein
LGKEKVALIAQSVIAAAEGLSKELGFVATPLVEDEKQFQVAHR